MRILYGECCLCVVWDCCCCYDHKVKSAELSCHYATPKLVRPINMRVGQFTPDA